MKDIPKEVVFILLAVYAVILIIQSYVFLDYATTGHATTGTGTIGLCIGSTAQFDSVDCPDNVTAGYLYYCQVTASSPEGGNITYSNNPTTLFTIGSTTGIIAFSPTLSQIGMHDITITAFAGGNSCVNSSASAEITIDVTKPICGNDIVELGEYCDEGANNGHGTCSVLCTAESRARTSGATGAAGGGGGGTAARQEGYAGLSLAGASTLSITAGRTIKTPIVLQNTEDLDMNEVFIEPKGNPLLLSIEPSYIPKVAAGESVKLTLTIDANYPNGIDKPTDEVIEVFAFSKKPKFEKKHTIIVTIIPSEMVYTNPRDKPKSSVSKLERAYKLLSEHPECALVSDIIKQAQDFVVDGDFEKANALAQSAIDICNFITGVVPKTAQAESTTPVGEAYGAFDNLANKKVISNMTVGALLIGIILMLLTAFMFKHSQKSIVLPSEKKSMSKEPVSLNLERVQAIIKEVYKSRDREDVESARKSYANLRKLYSKLNKKEQAVVYTEIISLYKEIEDMVKNR